MTYILGLTGGIASGKSTISSILRKYGFCIIDGDKITHELQKKGNLGYKLIVKEFGEKYIDDNGDLNRLKLGDFVFHHKGSMNKLNHIMKNLIIKEVFHKIRILKQNGKSHIVLDMPLLFSTDYSILYNLCDAIMLVKISRDIQIKYLMKRNELSYAQAISRINNQALYVNNEKKADIIIDNNGDILDLENNLLKWLKNYKGVN